MNVGDNVRIVKCDACTAVVGKTAKVKELGDTVVVLNFGRGRPQTNRPSVFNLDDVSLVKE